MAKDPGFIFYPGDYLRDTQTLSEKTQVAYDRIMCEHMRNICISKQQLKFFTKRLNPDEVEELMFVLTETTNGFQIEWVADSISKRRAYSESRRKNRSNKTKKHINNISKTYEKHMEIENEIEDVSINRIEKEKINFSEIVNTQFFEGVIRFVDLKITMPQLLEYWNKYTDAMLTDGDLYRNKESYRGHFRNWVKIQVEKNGNESSLLKLDKKALAEQI